MLKLDRLELLRLLSAIAETGSLSAAAVRIGVSQPSATRRVRDLEAMVGAPLVKRSNHSSRLTPAGERLVGAGRSLLGAWEEAVEAARADSAELAGHLRVVAPVAAGQGIFASIMARFMGEHPAVTIDWMLNDEPIDPVSQGVDLWIRVGEVPTEALVVRELWEIDRAIVAGPRMAALTHPEQLAPVPAVQIRTFVPDVIKLVHQDGGQFLVRQNAVLKVDNVYAARAALLEGFGYGVLPLWSIQRHLCSGALVLLCPDWRPPTISLCLAYAPGRFRQRRLAALINAFKSELTRADGLGIRYLERLDARATVHINAREIVRA